MRISKIFFVLTLITIIVCFGSIGFASEKPIKLIGAEGNPPDHVFYRTLVKFNELVKEYYPEPIEFELHHSGDIGAEVDFLEYMIEGDALDFAIVAPSWMSNWNEKLAFMDTPFLFENIDQWDKALNSGVFNSLEEELINDIGIRIVGYCGGGIRNMILKSPIRNTKDLKKVKMRVMGSPIQANVFNAIGVQATPIDYLETYNSIKTGVVDGCEGEAGSITAQKFYEVAQYVILTEHAITIRPICFSEKRFQSYPKELQNAILKAGKEASEFGRNTEVNEGIETWQALQNEGKIVRILFDSSEMRKMAEPVIIQYAEKLGVEDLLTKIRNIK